LKQTKGRNSFQKQFFSLLLAVSVGTVLLCLLMNNLFLERFYTRHKKRAMNQVYLQINQAAEENTLLSKEFQSRLQEMAEKKKIRLKILGRREDPLSMTHNLFRILRECDEEGINLILSESYPEEGVGFALMNRMKKAAGQKIILIK